jgi:hypothetical protein
VSHEKILTRYLGRWFSFSSEDAAYEGRLLHFDADNLFLQPDTTDPLIQVVERVKLTEVFYPSLPEGLFLEPTLRWEVESRRDASDIPVELSYLAQGINWLCNYRAELAGPDSLELAGSFAIANELPLEFPRARMALVAGWTHRAEDKDGGEAALGAETGADPGGERLFEYYRYPLPNPLDLRSKQNILVPFFSPRRVKAERRFVLPHLLDQEPVQIKLSFLNQAAAGLGFSLPEGGICIYRRSADGNLEFIGEDIIEFAPVGEKVEVDVGRASDLTATRTRTAQTRPDHNRHQELWRVEIASARKEPAVVFVEHRVFGYYTVENPAVNDQPADFLSEEAGKIVFPVTVPGGSRSILTFALTYGY